MATRGEKFLQYTQPKHDMYKKTHCAGQDPWTKANETWD